MGRAKIVPTADPFARLGVVDDHVPIAYLGLQVEITGDNSLDVLLNDLTVCLRSHNSRPHVPQAIATLTEWYRPQMVGAGSWIARRWMPQMGGPIWRCSALSVP